jgi:hypothetical protein
VGGDGGYHEYFSSVQRRSSCVRPACVATGPERPRAGGVWRIHPIRPSLTGGRTGGRRVGGALRALLDDVDDATLTHAFGDRVQVTIRRRGPPRIDWEDGERDE